MTLAAVSDLMPAGAREAGRPVHLTAVDPTVGARSSGGPQDLRQGNLSQILRYLHDHGPSSRRDIATGCGLAISTLTALIGELKTHRLVTEMNPVRSAHAGRPTRPIALDGDPWCVLGVHLTSDTVSVVARTAGGEELWLDSRRRHGHDGPAGQVRDLLLDHLTSPDSRRVVAVMTAVSDHTAAGWDLTAQELQAVLASAGLIDEPCLVEAGAATALAGLQAARQLGLGPRATVVYLGGLGELTGGLVVDGRIFTGAGGAAGSVAHASVTATRSVACECGRASCLNSVAAPAALLTRAGLLDETAARRVVLDDPESALALLVSRAAAGDPRVLATLDVAGLALGQVLDNMVGLLDPHAVILGDYLGALHPYLSSSLAARSGRVRVLEQPDPARVARGAALAGQSSILAAPLALTRPIHSDANRAGR